VSKSFEAVKVTDHVYWVGAIDWAGRDFHGYSTDRGTTYNAYLILADKITLIDTVKAPFKDELLSRIASVIDPGRIDYVISNHSEMDHSGCLEQVLEAVRPERVFASAIGVKTLSDHFHVDREIVALKDGESLSLGDFNLTFLETRMLHWPDSMFTYLSEEKLLFSQDAFGMHLASSHRFADEIEDAVLAWEAKKYYANILLPFSPLVTKLLERVAKLGLAFDTVAPDHGPIWRKDLGRILGWYSSWALQKRRNKAVVTYDTMWQSTARMAKAIGEGLSAGGTETRLLPLRMSHRSDIVSEVLEAGALLVGSPTLNNSIFPTVADLLTYLKGLKPKNLIGAAFGSYGWSGEAVKQLNETLASMGVSLVDDGLRVKYVPDSAAIGDCFSLGLRMSEKLKEVLGGE
jgi:flavorubredoxin